MGDLGTHTQLFGTAFASQVWRVSDPAKMSGPMDEPNKKSKIRSTDVQGLKEANSGTHNFAVSTYIVRRLSEPNSSQIRAKFGDT
jgi:hypothetical protein